MCRDYYPNTTAKRICFNTYKKRLTFMNKKDHIQSDNSYRLAGTLSFINDTTFIGGVMTQSFGLVGFSALIKF